MRLMKVTLSWKAGRFPWFRRVVGVLLVCPVVMWVTMRRSWLTAQERSKCKIQSTAASPEGMPFHCYEVKPSGQGLPVAHGQMPVFTLMGGLGTSDPPGGFLEGSGRVSAWPPAANTGEQV